MMTIHLAGVGGQYHPTEIAKSGHAKLLGPVERRPTRTLCNLSVPHDVAERGRVMLPHGHPNACPVCVAKRQEQRNAFVIPLLFSDLVSA